MKVIKLIERVVNVNKDDNSHSYTYEDLWFNANYLLYMSREKDVTRIVTVDGSVLFVKDTPEQITNMLQGPV